MIVLFKYNKLAQKVALQVCNLAVVVTSLFCWGGLGWIIYTCFLYLRLDYKLYKESTHLWTK